MGITVQVYIIQYVLILWERKTTEPLINIKWQTYIHFNIHTHTYICYTYIFITRDSEVIMFSPCVFVCLFVCGCLCLSRCLSGRFNYEGLVPHKQYFAGTLLGMSSCASYVSHTDDVIDDVTRSQSRSNFELIYLLQYLSYSVDQKLKCRTCSWISFWYIQLPE